MAANDETPPDPRTDFFCSYLLKMMNLKADKWQKMISSIENREVLDNFLNEPESKLLLFLNNGTTVTPFLNFQSNVKGTYLYFFRKPDVHELTIENMYDSLILGTCSTNPIQDLNVMANDVFVPVLTNPLNQKQWPLVVVSDVGQKLQELRNNIAEVIGKINNVTVLPLPITLPDVLKIAPEVERGELDNCTLDIKESLEQITVKWWNAIDCVVKEESYSILEINRSATPNDEILFWLARLKNLDNISGQLNESSVKAIEMLLEKTGSIYSKTYRDASNLVINAIDEARDINRFLKPLLSHIDTFESKSFDKNFNYIRLLIHTICLIWAHSQYYCTNKRMYHLFTLTSNMLMIQATNCLQPEDIFQGDADDNSKKVNQVIENFVEYKLAVMEYWKKLETFRKPNSKSEYWSFHPEAIFNDLDIYMSRLTAMKDIFEIAFEFKKLEEVVVGGLNGRNTNRSIKNLIEKFGRLYASLETGSKNLLNIYETGSADKLLKSFYDETSDLERSLAKQFNLAFDECVSSADTAKLFIVLGSAVYRPIIFNELKHRFKDIMYTFEAEIKFVRGIFERDSVKILNNANNIHSAIDSQLPALNGDIAWARQLKGLLQEPFELFSYLDVDIFDDEYGQQTVAEFKDMIELLDNFIKIEIIEKWSNNVANSIATFMDRTLLTRNGSDQTLRENFSMELKAAFKSINYLRGVPTENEAIKNFANREKDLAMACLKLKRVVQWYNTVVLTAHDTEKAMIAIELETIDRDLDDALTNTNWNNYQFDYIERLFNSIKNLHDRLIATQNNIQSMVNKIQEWGKVPLYSRINNKPEALLNIANRTATVRERFLQCLETRRVIQKGMLENYRLFMDIPVTWCPCDDDDDDESDSNNTKLKQDIVLEKRNQQVIVPKELEKDEEQEALYRPYEEYVDEIVSKEILAAIETSIGYIKREIDNVAEVNITYPIIETKFDLQNPLMVFIPNLEADSKHGLIACVESIIIDIFGMTDMITRIVQPISSGNSENAENAEYSENEKNSENSENSENLKSDDKLLTYGSVLETNAHIEKLKNDMLKTVGDVCKKVKETFQKYAVYEHIWLTDRHTYLRQFLMYGRGLTAEEIATVGTEAPTIKETSPTLDMFRGEIDRYNSIEDEVKKIPRICDTEGWLRINLNGFVISLLHEVRTWSTLFKNYLRNHVTQSLQEFEDFLKEAMNVLTMELSEKEFDKLLTILDCLRQVETRKSDAEELFELIKNEIELLRDYKEDFPNKVHLQVTDLPETWNKVKKAAMTMSQTIIPVQAYQIDLNNKRVVILDMRLKCYRKMFKDMEFYNADCANPYEQLDRENAYIISLEEQCAKLQATANLFTITGPDNTSLTRCRHEIKLLKQLWDFVHTIKSCIESWKSTTWKKINVDEMDQECKRFSKELRMLEKEVHISDPYIEVESVLKNLMTSLRAITELQNPSLRVRHWNELMKTTNVQFSLDDSTTLADLLDLNLYKFEEDVKNIVDKAVKEMAMEKLLKDFEVTWKQTEFEYEVHGRTQLKLLRLSEETLELLEENQSQLCNMMSSKFIGFFLTEVSSWQQILGNTDLVIKAWFEVQRKWMYLETIFIGSEDIRKQLPEDTERFIQIDEKFKQLLAEMLTEPNVVKACSVTDLINTLEAIQSDLILCEKAINDYLETKRLAFPRFYFVSSADLLDILSNGSTPMLVCKHLTKLFDSLAKLIFKEGTKMAVSMLSKENEEVVNLTGDCDCEGQVEIWLNTVIDSMRQTLHGLFKVSRRLFNIQQFHTNERSS